MSKLKWVALALAAIIAILFVQDRIAYSDAKSKALEGCVADFDARFSGSHEQHVKECEDGFKERGH